MPAKCGVATPSPRPSLDSDETTGQAPWPPTMALGSLSDLHCPRGCFGAKLLACWWHILKRTSHRWSEDAALPQTVPGPQGNRPTFVWGPPRSRQQAFGGDKPGWGRREEVMTGLWSKEGTEQDKRGQRLRGREFSSGLARPHAGSPGVWVGGRAQPPGPPAGQLLEESSGHARAVTASRGVQIEWGSQ